MRQKRTVKTASLRTSEFGQKVTELRVDRQITQSELADFAGLSAGYVSHLETGRRKPTNSAIRKIAGPLGVMPVVLIRAAGRTLPLQPSIAEPSSVPDSGADSGLGQFSFEGPVRLLKELARFWEFLAYIHETELRPPAYSRSTRSRTDVLV